MTQTVGAILVDDYSGNLKLWKEAGGIAVKFSKVKEESEYINITSLEELLEIF